MLNIGPQELILVLIVALVVVGPTRLPELGRTIGRVLRELRKIQDDVKDTIKFDLNDDEPYVPPVRRPRTSAARNVDTANDIVDPASPPDVEIEPTEGEIEAEADDEPRAAE
jgi:Tat protein translocase TatB subunit